jgi:ribose 5-phosphate isomerase B
MIHSVIIGCDHGGFAVKGDLIERLRAKGLTVTDLGTDSPAIVPYPRYARAVAEAVASGRADRGILICSTGIGMAIAANKFPGIRAALCTSTYMAKMTRRHNDANVLCLGGKITGVFELLDILDAWLENDYEGGRHAVSLDLIRDIEAQTRRADAPGK